MCEVSHLLNVYSANINIIYRSSEVLCEHIIYNIYDYHYPNCSFMFMINQSILQCISLPVSIRMCSVCGLEFTLPICLSIMVLRLRVDTVLIFLFNWTSKVFAINEFSYVVRKQKYFGSTFWHWYSILWNFCITYPLAILSLNVLRKVLVGFQIEQLNPLIRHAGGYISFLGIGLSTIIQCHQRRNLRKVLNTFGKLHRMQREFFGNAARIPLKTLATVFLRNCAFMYYRSNTGSYLLTLHHCRTFMLYYLVDVSMILHLKYIRSLASYLESNKRLSKKKRRFCIGFLSKLIFLRQKIQTLNWPIYLNKLVLEVLWTTMNCQSLYFVPEDERTMDLLISLFQVYISNLIPVLYMAKNIDMLERKIFDVLSERELLDSLKNPMRTHNWRLIKVSQKNFHIYT